MAIFSVLVILPKLFLTFNPNEKSLMFILNDYPADGEDISWIWDANFEKVLEIPNIKNFYCTGTRAEDVALRLKYAGFPTSKIRIYPSKDRFDIKPAMNNILSEDNIIPKKIELDQNTGKFKINII